MRIPGLLLLCCFTLPLAGCELWQREFGHESTTKPAVPTVSAASRVNAIRQAGEREAAANSAIDVVPLQDPGVAAWQATARNEERAGHYQAAAAALDQALRLSPEAPDLLQDRAEEAILLGDDAQAETLARKSWSLGSKIGPVCARNWQTIAEMRQQAGDLPGMTAAEQAVQKCHNPALPRY